MRIFPLIFGLILGAGLALNGLVLAASAQELEKKQSSADAPKAWAVLRFDEVNMRVGPSAEYPIDWVYRRKGLPVQIIRTREAWHLVRDHDGTRGWIASSQLRRTRGVLVMGESEAVLYAEPLASSSVNWRAQPGVVGRLLECEAQWCEIDIAGRRGWVDARRLWGAEDIAAE